jgi:hypothetical protein
MVVSPDAEGPGEAELEGDEAGGIDALVDRGVDVGGNGRSEVGGVGAGVGRGVALTPCTVTGSVALSPRTHRASGSVLNIRTSSRQRPAAGTLIVRPGTREGLFPAGT